MNTIIKRLTAAASSAVIAVCSAGINYSFGADTEEKTYKVHFALGEDVTIVPDDDGNVPVIKDVTDTYNSAVFIPRVELEREGYYFTGWTADDLYGYVGGSIFRIPDHDVDIVPVWNKKGDTVNHTVKFSVVIDGEERTDYEKMVPAQKGPDGTLVEIPMNVFPRSGYTQRGWTDGTHLFEGQQHIILHDEDITLEPNWCKKYLLTYTVGDADRINGTIKQEYEVMETGSVNLQSSSRFSRSGFEIAGWHCETDGKDYRCDQSFVMPASDVVMTPIWEPINYTVVFFANTGSNADNVRIKGKTDTTIQIPECKGQKEGYTFGGWQIGDDIYQPGDDYLIVGAKPGFGISFNAVWTPAGSEVTTTTTTTSATNTTSAATTVTSTTTVTDTSETTLPSTTTAKAVKAYEISVVDKETGKPVNDVFLSAKNTISEEGTSRESELPIDTKSENPKKVDYRNLKKDTSLVSIKNFSVNEFIYNGFAYKLDEKDIVSEIKGDTAYYTIKLSKKSFPDDVNPYSQVVKVYDKATNELINDVTVYGHWDIVYTDAITAPAMLIDTSAANPAIISYEKYKGSTSCTLTITGVSEGYPYTFSKDDYKIEKDDEKNIVTHNIYLTKSEVTYGDANGDGSVDMSDVVLIMQALANPNKFDINGSDEHHITEKGRANADVWNTGDGLTTEDALHIQKYLLGLCEITAKVEITASPE